MHFQFRSLTRRSMLLPQYRTRLVRVDLGWSSKTTSAGKVLEEFPRGL
jgi:hypothetical protein